MKLTLNRTTLTPDYTEGQLFIDGNYFCDTVEDAVRETKIPGKTAISAGEYTVVMSMSNRFKKVLPLLLNVPNFEGVRIHSGNSASDSEGCILVGVRTSPGWISRSRDTYDKLHKIINNSSLTQIEIK